MVLVWRNRGGVGNTTIVLNTALFAPDEAIVSMLHALIQEGISEKECIYWLSSESSLWMDRFCHDSVVTPLFLLYPCFPWHWVLLIIKTQIAIFMLIEWL